MQLPFTAEQFFHAFSRYNLAIWPAQWILTALALLWLWMGAVYHLGFFASINPAARAFGAAFIVEAALWLWVAARARPVTWRVRPDVDGLAGGLLVAYAFAVYPVIGVCHGTPLSCHADLWRPVSDDDLHFGARSPRSACPSRKTTVYWSREC